ncbi:helix-turn-helix transcriptional regulator [Marimonas arenosa]|uniref:Helix-turn-helix transcriptional regulator n=1 Tax=Marimonas arenosa TaxID=1795305 RepID=A0AAE4B6N5_9RHOB|nr:helix-turn-helix transcriptional regulator [Marimonas arenosa]MDQ2090621.1 helix-turn-helix transcriptional regulator [Marimonas arenosa]
MSHPPGDLRRASLLAAALALQTLAAVFFIGDVASDYRWIGFDPHTTFEAMVALALIIGIGISALEMRRTLLRIRRAEEALSLASGAFAEVIEARFAGWGLTPAEADVALFTLKGLETSEIAALRSAAESTVRAQLTRVFAKSGAGSRAQFVALFVEDLLENARAGPDSGL